MKTYIGIDNGVTGSIGIISGDFSSYIKTPVFKEQDYTKKVQNISRIQYKELKDILAGWEKPFAVIERPMVNPTRYRSTLSAVRCLEATLITLESLNIPRMFVDSKEWQKLMLNKPKKGSDLKQLSRDYAKRLFPNLKETIDKLKDGDGILIAEWARRSNL